MPELRVQFRSSDEWRSWWESIARPREVGRAMLAAVAAHGLVEPFTGIRRRPHEILIDPDNLEETVRSHELNARKRAVLAQLLLELKAAGRLDDLSLRILSPEGATRPARILRGVYPRFLGTEFLPTEAERDRLFPIPHMDPSAIPFDRETFDVFFGRDLLHQVADLEGVLGEIARVLRPGGLLVTAFPFAPRNETTATKEPPAGEAAGSDAAGSDAAGTEAAGAPSAARRAIGWDILDALAAAGFEDARFNFIGSSKFGILGSGLPGGFTLTAVKERGAEAKARPPAAPPAVTWRGEWPEALFALLGLPRSGTTLLASVFAVHSRFEAVYEPWNAKLLPVDGETSLETLIEKARLPDLAGKNLLVKETTADLRYPWRLWHILQTLPPPVARQLVFIVRKPAATFFSEFRRRNEWWGDNLSLDEDFFTRWCQRSRESLQVFSTFTKQTGATFIALESLAEAPETTLVGLAERTGFVLEENQLHYEQYVEKKRVRGDLNVGSAPQAISPDAVGMEDSARALVDDVAARSETGSWFRALEAFHGEIMAAGGVATEAELPRQALPGLVD